MGLGASKMVLNWITDDYLLQVKQLILNEVGFLS